jgi:hypothetical protein
MTVFKCTAALTLALTAAATLGNGFIFIVHASGFDVTIDPDGAETINAASTLTVPNGSTVIVYGDGTAWRAFMLPTPSSSQSIATLELALANANKDEWMIAVPNTGGVLVAGTNLAQFRAPFAGTLTRVRAALKTAATSGTVTVDINENGTTVLSTKLTIDATEKTSTTAAVAAVISDTAIADDAEITIDVDDDGAGDAVDLKVGLSVTRTS